MEGFWILQSRGGSTHTRTYRYTHAFYNPDAYSDFDPHATTHSDAYAYSPHSHPLPQPDRYKDAHAVSNVDAHTGHAKHHAPTNTHPHPHAYLLN